MDGITPERRKTLRRPIASPLQLSIIHFAQRAKYRGLFSPYGNPLAKLGFQAIFAAAIAAAVTWIQHHLGIGETNPGLPAATVLLLGSTASRSRKNGNRSDETSDAQKKRIGISKPNDTPSPVERGAINWQLFSSLSLPGENTAFTLLDGNGEVIEATPAASDLWKTPHVKLLGSPLEKLFQEPETVRSWYLDLEKDSLDNPFKANITTSEGFTSPAFLKRIPIFISSDPTQTRVILKTVSTDADVQNKPKPAPSSVHAINSVFESSNLAWADLLGYTAAELRDRPLSDFVVPEDVELSQSLFKRAADSERPIRSLLRLKAKNGSVRTLMTSIVSNEDTPSFLLTGKEITLQNGNTDLLTSSIELIQEGIIILAREKDGFRIRHANQAFENKTGYQIADARGATISKFTGPKTNPRALAKFEQAVSHEAQYECELILYRKNGDPFWTKTSMYPLRNDEGIATHCVIVIEDTTEIKAVAAELAQKNIDLEKAVANLKQTQKTVVRQENLRALGQMASGIAHDFNNLLAPILGFSELLLNTPAPARDNAKLESFLKKIQVAAQDGAAVVSRLREFYRSQNSDEDLTLIQLPHLIDQVKELTRHRWKNQAEANGTAIQFVTDITTRQNILANEPELRQVLTNLVINAVDATKENGAITIRAFDDRKRVCIQVIDTGSGMPLEVQKNCLEPFYTTKGQLGTGLGLSIAYGVVERLNGKIRIDSKEGAGTTIHMSFPIARHGGSGPQTDGEEDEHKSLNIMLVDDEEVLLEVISELLSTSGHTVREFSSPQKALEAFKAEDYDLIITDRAMPTMSGDQLAKEIRKIDSDVAIYMITGFGDVIKETGKIPENVDEVLCKPVPLDLLRRKLNELAAAN